MFITIKMYNFETKHIIIIEFINLIDMPKVSVCMPMYNAERYIRESIDSILAQTFQDFELLIVDDGSTDSSCQIIMSYKDPRIRLIRNTHDFIGTSNMLIENARGEYIARMDSDDRMLPNRLQMQVDIMEEHPEIDILGGGFVRFGKGSNYYIPQKPLQRLKIGDFIGGNCIANPTVMMRRQSILSSNVCYEQEYIYAEDFRFWITAVVKGLYLTNTDTILIEYRTYDEQVSSVHTFEQVAATEKAIASALKTINRKEYLNDSISEGVKNSSNELTVIIPFLNEGEEVKLTVESIRETAGNAVDIIVINDCSYDGYDYRNCLEDLDVNYIFNTQRKGVAESRNLGVRLCRTPYFLLLDAHMRFYDRQWHVRIADRLKADDRILLCCQTKILGKDTDGNVFEQLDVKKHFGAYMPLQNGEYLPDIKWNNTERCPNDNEEDIPFVLGAGYATSCRYWLYLRGLDGLKQYGSDEAYISLKVWREGGRCILLKDVVIGHIYRTAFPYKNDNAACVYNNLFIASLLFPESLRRRAFKIAESLNSSLYQDALKMLNSNASLIEELKAYYDSVFTRSFKDVVKLHQIVQPDDKEFADKYSNVLPKIAETIMDNINGNGIVKGKIGAAIWYYEYANYSSESKWTYIADNLLESVLADIVSADLGSDFNEGLSGIGWGLMYMRERKLTKININEAIEFIHNKDNSLSSEDMPLSLNMVFEITPFIPRNPKRWDYSMNGVLGTSLHIMEIYRMLGNNTLF